MALAAAYMQLCQSYARCTVIIW